MTLPCRRGRQAACASSRARPRHSPLARVLVGCIHQLLGLVHAAQEGRVQQLLWQISGREREEQRWERRLHPGASLCCSGVLPVPPAPREISTAVLAVIAAAIGRVCSSGGSGRVTSGHEEGIAISGGFKQPPREMQAPSLLPLHGRVIAISSRYFATPVNAIHLISAPPAAAAFREPARIPLAATTGSIKSSQLLAFPHHCLDSPTFYPSDPIATLPIHLW